MDALGTWGERWLDVEPEHADPGYTLNSWCATYLAVEKLPDRRVVTRFEFVDRPTAERTWWIIFDGADSEVCRRAPDFEDDLIVVADSVALTEWHLGRISWRQALDEERIQVDGVPRLARALPTWNRRSQWAHSRRANAPSP